MTPKDKCDELFEKYYECNFYTFGFYCKSTAKQCALICVDEIISSMPSYPKEINTLSGNVFILVPHLNYWQEVKTEIEKL